MLVGNLARFLSNSIGELAADEPAAASSGQSPGPANRPSFDPTSAERQRVWSSDELFGEQQEVLIAHGDLVYRLRRTRNGKLILCK